MPYGFPSARGLRSQIINALIEGNPTDERYRALCRYGYRDSALKTFAQEFLESGQSSIDRFLELRKDYIGIGKHILAAFLIDRENPGSLHLTTSDELNRDWYHWLWNRLEIKSAAELADSRVSFVTFNYDRSLEKYLVTAASKSFNLSEAQASDAVKNLSIHHMYGSLGNLPHFSGEDVRGYEPRIGDDTLDIAARSILIPSDNFEDSRKFDQVKRILEDASRVVFLGFSFTRLNVERLGIRLDKSQPHRISASAYGLSPIEMKEANRIIPGQSIKFGDPAHDSVLFLRHNDPFYMLDV